MPPISAFAPEAVSTAARIAPVPGQAPRASAGSGRGSSRTGPPPPAGRGSRSAARSRTRGGRRREPRRPRAASPSSSFSPAWRRSRGRPAHRSRKPSRPPRPLRGEAGVVSRRSRRGRPDWTPASRNRARRWSGVPGIVGDENDRLADGDQLARASAEPGTSSRPTQTTPSRSTRSLRIRPPAPSGAQASLSVHDAPRDAHVALLGPPPRFSSSLAAGAPALARAPGEAGPGPRSTYKLTGRSGGSHWLTSKPTRGVTGSALLIRGRHREVEYVVHGSVTSSGWVYMWLLWRARVGSSPASQADAERIPKPQPNRRARGCVGEPWTDQCRDSFTGLFEFHRPSLGYVAIDQTAVAGGPMQGDARLGLLCGPLSPLSPS